MPRAVHPGRWVVSRRTGVRAAWSLLGVAVFAVATVVAAAMFARDPQVDSFVLILIAAPFLVMAVVLGVEVVGQGLVRVDAAGYATVLGRRRRWADVLAVEAANIGGRDVAAVAVRDAAEPLGLGQDVFTGFADAEASELVATLRGFVDPPGLAGVRVPEAWWVEANAEAQRASAVVREATGREPVAVERIEFGFTGLPTALYLDYGTNPAGDGVGLIVRRATDLALIRDGRRWLRQHRRRSPDPATQVGALFGPLTVTVVPSDGAGLDRLVVEADGGRIVFNAEEPDRY